MWIKALTLLTLLTSPALAEGSLAGRMVTMSTLTYETPDAALMESRGVTVKVGDGVEFGMGPEGAQNGLDVVPVAIEILPRRIEISYPPPAGSGTFWKSAFNGYVLRFEGECALFTGAKLDPSATNMAVTATDITLKDNALYINVSDRAFGPALHMAIDLDVTDCQLS